MRTLKFKKIITSNHLQRPSKSKPLIILEDNDTYFYVSYQPFESFIKLPQYSVFINVDDLKQPKNVFVDKDVVDTTKIYLINKSDFSKYYNENEVLKIEDLYTTKQLQIYSNLYKNLNQNYLGLIEVNQNQTLQFYTWYSHIELVKEDLRKICNNPILDTNEIIKFNKLYEKILNQRNKDLNTLEFLEDIKIWVNEKIELINDLIYQVVRKNEEKDEKEEY